MKCKLFDTKMKCGYFRARNHCNGCTQQLEMNRQEIIDKHEKAGEVLDLIEYAHRRIESKERTLEMVKGSHVELEKRLPYENEITRLAIERLYKIYYKIIG